MESVIIGSQGEQCAVTPGDGAGSARGGAGKFQKAGVPLTCNPFQCRQPPLGTWLCASETQEEALADVMIFIYLYLLMTLITDVPHFPRLPPSSLPPLTTWLSVAMGCAILRLISSSPPPRPPEIRQCVPCTHAPGLVLLVDP